MPKKIKLEDLKISKKPIIETIGYNHKPACTFPQTNKERDCGCVKYFYITAAEGERYRVSSGYTSWKDARAEANRLEHELSPEVREHKAKEKVVGISPEQLFDLYIQSKENGQEQKRLDEYGPSPSVNKAKTLRTIFVKFLAQWNALPREQKKIEATKTIDRIEFADEITTYWLEHAWRPTWFAGKGSFWSQKKRLELVSAIWHFGQKNRYLPDQRSNKNCECIACSMMKPRKQTTTVQRTPPFTLAQYAQIVDSCALYEASYHDVNTKQLRISNQRLRAFVEVMRYCGPRIIDVSLLRKDAIHVLPNGKISWHYVPVKNGDEGAELIIPMPNDVYRQLQALPDEPGFDPEYYFWSGDSYKRNAPDPWQRALARLWTLCPKEATEVKDARNKRKLNPSSHMFRNTFCVQCRLHGMTYAQIADAIGDTEEMVKNHYSPYCREYDAMLADKVESMQNAVERMQSRGAIEVEVLAAKGAHVVGTQASA